MHSTRDGHCVVVQSRWALEGQPGAVIEINTCSTDSHTNSEGGTDSYSAENGKQDAVAKDRSAKSALNRLLGVRLLTLGAIWLVYALFGRLAIRVMYMSNFEIADRIMRGKTSTPLQYYYWHAEQLLWYGTLTILAASLICWLISRNFYGSLLAGFSALMSSFLFFCMLEIFPHLIDTFHLDTISPYLAYRASFLDDEQLIYREKPFNRNFVARFTGANYSPLYRIDVPPWTVDWKVDENGFRNSRRTDSADVVVLGDSYMDYGQKESDTFPGRLQPII